MPSSPMKQLVHMLIIYSKSHISTSTRIGLVPKGCTKLRVKILKRYHDVFKDEHDRIKMKPVHLEIDASRKIIPKHCNKPYDINFNLCAPVQTELMKQKQRSGAHMPSLSSS